MAAATRNCTRPLSGLLTVALFTALFLQDMIVQMEEDNNAMKWICRVGGAWAGPPIRGHRLLFCRTR